MRGNLIGNKYYSDDGQMSTRLGEAIGLLQNLLESNQIDAGHGIDHALIVLDHAREAMKNENLTSTQMEAIELAALLHDADDSKFFPLNQNFENTRSILHQIYLDDDEIDLVLRMISLVSCGKNRNNLVEPRWLLIPRWADRLEAMGKIGIYRAYVYGLHIGNPLFFPNTPRAKTLEELNQISTPARFEQYRGTSDSVIDHLYDKVLHLVYMGTDNPYFLSIAKERHQEVVDFCLEFGRTGVLDQQLIQTYKDQDLC